MRISSTSLLFIFLVSSASSNLFAQGLSDPNITAGKLKTEYSSDLGTSTNPVDLKYNQSGLEGCKFDYTHPDTFSACPGREASSNSVWLGTLQHRQYCGGSSTLSAGGKSYKGCTEEYDGNTDFSMNSPGSTYWMVHANNDPAFDECHEGPPGASEKPVDASTSAGLFRLYSEPYQEPFLPVRHRIHFVVYNADNNTDCGNTIPFLSVGAQEGRGNSTAVGTLNMNLTTSVKDRLKFGFEVIGVSAPNVFSWTGVFVLAEWGGIKRMVQVPLHATGDTAGDPAARTFWNWPVNDSIFFPGAEVAILPAWSDEASDCDLGIDEITSGDIGTTQYYDFRVSEVFKCALDEDLLTGNDPSGTIDLEGVHFYIETEGASGNVWSMIENVTMTY